MHKVILFLLVIPFYVLGQFIDSNPVGLGNDQFPQAQVKSYGIGNLGFDVCDFIYNPKYIYSQEHFHVYTSFNYNTKSHREYKTHNYNYNLSDGINSWGPTFDLKIVYKDYNFNLIYSNLIFFDQQIKGTYSYGFETSEGIWKITIGDPINEVAHKIFQFAISKRISQYLSFSIGIRSNYFMSRINSPTTIEFIDFQTKLIDNFQYLLAMNYVHSSYKLYFLVRTQNSLVNLKGEGFIDGYKILFENDPYVSFPGLIGYGFQYQILKDIKLSLEISHEYLSSVGRIYYGKTIKGHGIFNSEMSLGINYSLLTMFKLGLLYSHYLKYDDEIGLGSETGNSAFPHAEITNPWSVVFSIKYIYRNFEVSGYYQYSYVKYNLENYYRVEDSAKYFKISLGVSY